MANDESSSAFLEFSALRVEVDRRSADQSALITSQLTLSGAVFGFSLTGNDRVYLLLVIPLISYVICSRFITHALAIKRISGFFKEVLDARIASGLKWQEYSAGHPLLRNFSLLLWWIPLGVTFPGVALVSLAATLHAAVTGQPSINYLLFAPAWIIGVVLAVLCCWLVVIGQTTHKSLWPSLRR